MKIVLIASLLIFAGPAFAKTTTGSLQGCWDKASHHTTDGSEGSTLCSAFQNSGGVSVLLSCWDKAYDHTSDGNYAAELCSGIKTSANIPVLLACWDKAYDHTNDGEEAAKLCAHLTN